MMESYDRARVTNNQAVSFDTEGMVRLQPRGRHRSSVQVFVAPAPTMVPKWTALIRPFTWQIWSLVFVTIFCFSVVLAFVAFLYRSVIHSQIEIAGTYVTIRHVLFTLALEATFIHPTTPELNPPQSGPRRTPARNVRFTNSSLLLTRR